MIDKCQTELAKVMLGKDFALIALRQVQCDT